MSALSRADGAAIDACVHGLAQKSKLKDGEWNGIGYLHTVCVCVLVCGVCVCACMCVRVSVRVFI